VERLSLKQVCLLARYRALHERRDLDDSLALGHTLLDDLTEGAKDRPAVLHQLGAGLRARYTLDGDSGTLTQAVAAFRDAATDGVGDSRWLEYATDFGTALSDRYDATGELQDLQDAIAINERALAIAAPEDVRRVLILDHLSMVLRTRGRRNRQLADIDSAIARAREAVENCRDTSVLYVSCLNGLATALFERYRWQSEAGVAEQTDIATEDLQPRSISATATRRH
jgi:hypothetical protein